MTLSQASPLAPGRLTDRLSAAATAAGLAPERAAEAVAGARMANRSPATALWEAGVMDELAFARALADLSALPFVADPLPDADQAVQLRTLCPSSTATQHRLVPLESCGDTDLCLALADPFDLATRTRAAAEIQATARSSARPAPVIRWVTAAPSRLQAALQRLYGVGAATFDAIVASRSDDEDVLQDFDNVIDADDDDASVTKLVNQIISEGLRRRATDIHIEPERDSLRIRYRIDGMLQAAPVPARIKALQDSLLSRLKVMAKLDIAEKRRPQDGRISLSVRGQQLDIRVATIPSHDGETISLRLLGQERFDLARLDLPPELLAQIEELLARPDGVILVTGPTGCGKSTTLYTFLSRLNLEQRRIVTIEDPVENRLPGVVQIAVRPEVDLTFASGLRSILRGDPNVIMVGEIRDLETAEIAVRASLTGHLVFSTLHTNDAIGAVPRLTNMGVEPFLIASAVRALMAQRLVRRLCLQCRQPASPDPGLLNAHRLPPPDPEDTIYSANPGGCETCDGTGFHGRLAIYELCVIHPDLEELITASAPASHLADAARRHGFRPMIEYGWDKVRSGDTTLEEVLAVARN